MTATSCVLALTINWNNYEDTAECLESLPSHDAMDVLVVDNGSTDGSGERLADEFEDVDVVFNDHNEGFAGGINRGFDEALERDVAYVWVLNNDLVIEDQTVLSTLLDTFESEEDVGIVSPRIMEYPDTETVWFERGYHDRATGMAGHAWYESTLDAVRAVLSGARSEPTQTTGVLENGYIPFCCALVDLKVVRDVGYYPTEYFLYYGDVDYCSRIRDAGFRLLTDCRVEVYHKVSASSGGDVAPVSSYYNARNRWTLARKFDVPIHRFLPAYGIWVATRLGYRLFARRLCSAGSLLLGALDGATGKEGRGRYP